VLIWCRDETAAVNVEMNKGTDDTIVGAARG